jgi:hypothetical protein
MKITLTCLIRSLVRFGGLVLIVMACSVQKKTITVSSQTDDAEIRFAIEELTTVLEEKGMEALVVADDGDIAFGVQPGTDGLKEEGFSIQKSGNRIQIIGFR